MWNENQVDVETFNLKVLLRPTGLVIGFTVIVQSIELKGKVREVRIHLQC